MAIISQSASADSVLGLVLQLSECACQAVVVSALMDEPLAKETCLLEKFRVQRQTGSS